MLPQESIYEAGRILQSWAILASTKHSQHNISPMPDREREFVEAV